MTTILFAASEIAPEASTGGLGEVIASLPHFLETQAGGRHDVAVALPGYPALMEDATELDVRFSLAVGDSLQPVSVFERVREDGTQLLLIHNDAFFGRPNLYGDSQDDYADNASRYIFFSRAVVELAKRLDPSPKILQLNDWQTALIPVLVRDQQLPFKTVLTIHNAAYQGSFPAADFAFTNLPAHWMSPSGLEFYGALNLLKGGILTADVLTTVGSVYRRQLLSPGGGNGLHAILAARANDLFAAPNGVDTQRWSPETSTAIVSPFSAEAPGGKLACRSNLLSEVGMEPAPSGPVFAMLTRLADQKGFDLLLPLLPKLLSSDCRLIIAGDGDPSVRKDLLTACRQHLGKLAFLPSWDPAFPERLLSGADVLLAPSHFEPCGLAPLQAIRFGCIPVAHATGGMMENLSNFDPKTGKGNALLYFADTSAALWDAIVRAKLMFRDKTVWAQPMNNALRSEFSWEKAGSVLNSIYSRLAP